MNEENKRIINEFQSVWRIDGVSIHGTQYKSSKNDIFTHFIYKFCEISRQKWSTRNANSFHSEEIACIVKTGIWGNKFIRIHIWIIAKCVHSTRISSFYFFLMPILLNSDLIWKSYIYCFDVFVLKCEWKNNNIYVHSHIHIRLHIYRIRLTPVHQKLALDFVYVYFIHSIVVVRKIHTCHPRFFF